MLLAQIQIVEHTAFLSMSLETDFHSRNVDNLLNVVNVIKDGTRQFNSNKNSLSLQN